MGLKHGMKLAAISGVNGVFSDEDIFKVRDLALKARNDVRNDPGKKAEQPAKVGTSSGGAA
jgi:hypothetical protein